MEAKPELPATLALTDPKLAALALAIGGRLVRVQPLASGRLQFVLDGVPSDLPERVLNDTVVVSGKSFITAMEGVLAIIAERRPSRRDNTVSGRQGNAS